jgi:hypothetical protein
MSILHMRRNVKRRILERKARDGERVSAPHEYERASVRAECAAAEPAAAVLDDPAKAKPRRRRKAKAKRKPRAWASA